MSRRVPPLTGFQVTIHGWFWVTAEEWTHRGRIALAKKAKINQAIGHRSWTDVKLFSKSAEVVLVVEVQFSLLNFLSDKIRRH